MNKQTISLKLIVLFTLLTTVLSTNSCYAQADSIKNAIYPVGKKNKAPKIDIHTAVINGDLNALRQHIAAGTNLDEPDPVGGSSPLITAALFDKKEMAKALLEAGAKINFRNNDGSTALHTAAFFCRTEIVKLLLEKGADKTIRNKWGSTPFESVKAPFVEAKDIYDIMSQLLEPWGINLDYAWIEKTRPEIAAMLKLP